MTELKKLACQVNAFTPEQGERYTQVRATLQRAVTATQELPDGYEFRYSGGDDVFRLAAEFVTLERRCCPFFDFAVAWANDGSPVLRITGGEGVKAFIANVLR